MPVRLEVKSKAPLHVCSRATAALNLFSRGFKNYSRIKPNFYLVIRIGCRWRLLSKNKGKVWLLLTHETYNVESKK
jgi:hypothetical protein